LAKVPLDFAVGDIKAGKDFLESILGKQLRSFAYPYGAYTEQVQKAVLGLGFMVARTTERFSIAFSSEYSELPTTVHVNTHVSDVLLLPHYRTLQWQKLARYFFDQVMEKGGVFHLWGHSWEVNKYNEWENLEAVLEYISNREDVEYVSNGELA
jgi:peptidoglycan/xylan/chitin deacetylase (PgdA/CDA1 family)